MQRKAPAPGAILSYSAGFCALDPWKFREPRAGDKLKRAFSLFPNLAAFAGGRNPIVINCYPASLGTFPSAVFVDTYLRPENLSRAILLASETDLFPIVLAQPLAALDLLLQHAEKDLLWPNAMLLCLGGYYCATSLQRAITEIAAENGCESKVLHAYGMAEADEACLLGMDRTPAHEIIYLPALAGIRATIIGKKLFLQLSDGSSLDTGDFAEVYGSGFLIRNSPARLPESVRVLLENWTSGDWKRRTGNLRAFSAEDHLIQLRNNVPPLSEKELPFYDFAERFGHSWLNKPDWALGREMHPQLSICCHTDVWQLSAAK